MSIENGVPIPKIGPIGGIRGEIPEVGTRTKVDGQAFYETLRDAVSTVDQLQKESERSQVAYAQGAPVDLHDVLIKIEEADIAFRSMMEVRNKLVDAYREMMRLGSGG